MVSKTVLSFILCGVSFSQHAMEQKNDIILNSTCWCFILASMCTDSKEQGAQEFKKEILGTLKKLSLLSKSFQKTVNGIIAGSNDSASIFNNFFIAHMCSRVAFQYSTALNDKLDQKKILAAAWIGTPGTLQILQEDLKKKNSTNEIKIILDAKSKPVLKQTVDYLPGHNVAIRCEELVVERESIMDALGKFPKSTQKCCHAAIREKRKSDPGFAKSYSVTTELNLLEKEYNKSASEYTE